METEAILVTVWKERLAGDNKKLVRKNGQINGKERLPEESLS